MYSSPPQRIYSTPSSMLTCELQNKNLTCTPKTEKKKNTIKYRTTKKRYHATEWDRSKFKTKLCIEYQNGHCKFGKTCAFAHGVEDLLIPGAKHPKFRTTFCVHELTPSGCPYGAQCRFIHRTTPPSYFTPSQNCHYVSAAPVSPPPGFAPHSISFQTPKPVPARPQPMLEMQRSLTPSPPPSHTHTKNPVVHEAVPVDDMFHPNIEHRKLTAFKMWNNIQ